MICSRVENSVTAEKKPQAREVRLGRKRWQPPRRQAGSNLGRAAASGAPGLPFDPADRLEPSAEFSAGMMKDTFGLDAPDAETADMICTSEQNTYDVSVRRRTVLIMEA